MDIRRRSLLSETLHGGGSNEGLINIDNYLTIEALEDGLTASLSTNACEYCVDGDGNWKSLAAGTATESINTGHTLSFRGELSPTNSAGIGTFTISKKCNLKGNCMSMLFGDNADNNYNVRSYAFKKLFYGCTTLNNVSYKFLPGTSIANNSYESMFENCTNLNSAPELPATTLWYSDAYKSMFRKCTSLITPPELPATAIESTVYAYMFSGCSNLINAPVLHASSVRNGSYSYMFMDCVKLGYIKMLATSVSTNFGLNWVKGVATTGTFVKHPDMTTLPTGTSGIPSGWTVVNDGEESGGNLITFTIDSTQYQAEEGMTWEEFVNSSYNDGKFRINFDQIIYNDLTVSGQKSSTVIIENTNYTTFGYGGQ